MAQVNGGAITRSGNYTLFIFLAKLGEIIATAVRAAA
jgi:hypothetical protein